MEIFVNLLKRKMINKIRFKSKIYNKIYEFQTKSMQNCVVVLSNSFITEIKFLKINTFDVLICFGIKSGKYIPYACILIGFS